MNFYKFISLLAIVVLIICLAFVATALQTSSSEKVFPPHISECPDFYVKNANDECVAQFDVSGTSDDGFSCQSRNFKTYINPGMGLHSGICKKKNWAKNCGVNWDGITNNNDVCNISI